MTQSGHRVWVPANHFLCNGQQHVTTLLVAKAYLPCVILHQMRRGLGGMPLPLYRLLREASFDQADISCMTRAYEAALSLLRAKDQTDAIKELIAKKGIEITRTGEHDPPRICARALKELGLPH
jgi:hypothetical protein